MKVLALVYFNDSHHAWNRNQQIVKDDSISSSTSELPDVKIRPKPSPSPVSQNAQTTNPGKLMKFGTRIHSPSVAPLESLIENKRKESLKPRNLKGGFRSPNVIAMNAKLA